MPKQVDWGERREELLEAVWRVIAREGLERTTIRAIAAETGWSPGVLAHYFDDKDDILVSALRLAHRRIAARWEAKLAGLDGLEALEALLLDNLPLDDERELETRFLMNYWSRAVREPALLEVQWRSGPRLLDLFTELAEQAVLAGEIAPEHSAQDVAERLLALVDGLSLHAVLEGGRMTRPRMTELARRELAGLRQGPADRPDLRLLQTGP